MTENKEWMDSFYKKVVASILETGDVTLLWTAFVWDKTDQGHKFWSNIVDEGRELTLGVRATLQGMLTEWEAYQETNVPEPETENSKD